MAYYIFQNDGDNKNIVKVAENETDKNNLNIVQSQYKIIENTDIDFDKVKTGEIEITNWSGTDTINYNTITISSCATEASHLEDAIDLRLAPIKTYLDNNSGHADYTKWNSYKTQLETLKAASGSQTYPMDNNVEKHFKANSQNYYNILQLP